MENHDSHWMPRVFLKRSSQDEQQQRVRAYSIYDWEEEAGVRCWKRIMNTFFSIQWKIFLIFTIYITIFVIIMRLQTTPSAWDKYYIFDSLRIVCSVIYTLDTLIRLAHNKSKKLRETQAYKMHPTPWIVVDFLSIIPFILFYRAFPLGLIYFQNQDYSAYFLTNQLLRVYRIPLTIKEVENSFTFNPSSLYVWGTLAIFLVFIHFSEFIWLQVLGRWRAQEVSWMSYLKTVVGVNDTIELYGITFTVVLTMFCRFFTGVIQLTTNTERLIGALIWIIGLISEHAILFGGLIPILITMHKLPYVYAEAMQSLGHFLTLRDICPETSQRAQTYFKELQKRASGVKRSVLFDELPLSLRKELLLDVYWEAFKHSSLLSGLPVTLKRALCVYMEHEYYLPGEVLFQSGEPRDKMVYLLSGIVDVLACEDDETSVMSFSAGTCISEVALVFQYTEDHTVRCATFCEVQILHTWDAMSVLREYRGSMSAVVDTVQQRIQLATEVRRNAEAMRVAQPNALDEHAVHIGEIKWVKDHWRKVFELESTQRRRRRNGAAREQEHPTEQTQQPTDSRQPPDRTSATSGMQMEVYEDTLTRSTHTCAFFDLFAVTDETKKAEADLVFARIQFPWILAPKSDFMNLWEMVLMFIVFFECYLMPYYLSFEVNFPPTVTACGALIDALLIIDLYVFLFTVVPGIEVSTYAIFLYRAQTVVFYIRMIGTIPWHWIAVLLGVDYYDATRLRFLRMVWAAKIIGWFYEWTLKSNHIYYCIKYAVTLTSLLYWMACWQNLFNCYHQVCVGDSWYNVFMQEQLTLDNFRTDTWSRFKDMLMYCASNVFRTGLMVTSQVSAADAMLMVVMLVLGVLLATYWVAEMCALQFLSDRGERRFYDLVTSLSYYQARAGLPAGMYAELLRFLTFQWRINASFALEEQALLGAIPRYLRSDLKAAARDAVRAIPFFASGDPHLVEELANRVTFYECPHNMVLVRAGEDSPAVYVLRRGVCRCVSHWRPDVERRLTWTLSSGDCFPLMEVLHRVPPMTTVRTESACVVAMLEVRHLLRTLARFPAEQRIVESAVQAHRAAWALSDIPTEDPTQRSQTMQHRRRSRRYMLHRFTETMRAARGDRTPSPEEQGQTRTHQPPGQDQSPTDDQEEQQGGGAASSSSSSDSEFEFAQHGQDEEEAEYERAWRAAPLGNVLRRLVRARALDPSSPFVLRWEASRVALALAGALLHPCAYSALIGSVAARTICYLFDLLCAADIVLRLQIGYYNDEGILISHPALTAKHYAQNAFVIDLVSCFPFELLPMHLLFTVHKLARLRFFIRVLRFLQLYRFLVFLDYLSERLAYRSLTGNLFKAIALLLIAMSFAANACLFWNCDVRVEGGHAFYFHRLEVTCAFEGIMVETFLKKLLVTPLRIYLFHFYYVLLLYTTSTDGLVDYHASDVLRNVVISVVTFLARSWLVANVCSTIAGNRWSITRSRSRLHQVVKFLRRENVDERLVRLTEDSFNYEWRRSRGLHFPDILQKVPPLLQADVLFERCRATLRLVAPLRDGPDFLLRELARAVNLHLLTQGRFLFRVNDVQERVFIVERGRLEVLGADGAPLRSLHRGALLGNLARRRRQRHSCGVLVRTNCIAMSLANDFFYAILDKFPDVLARFDLVNLAQLEYLPGLGEQPARADPAAGRKRGLQGGWAVTRSDLVRIYAPKATLSVAQASIRKTVRDFVSSGALNAWALQFIVHVIIPACVVCVLLNSVLRNDFLVLLVIIYLCDVVYVVKMICMLTVPYVEPEAQESVKNPKQILMRNLKDPWRFPLDLLSTLPFEVCGPYRWLYCNRLLRVITFGQYYVYMYNELSASLTSRWIRLTILLGLIIVALASLHIIVRCDFGWYCEYLINIRNMHKADFHVALDEATIISLALMFSVSRFASASFTEPPFYLVSHLVYNIIITLLDHILAVYGMAYMACLVMGDKKFRCNFRYFVDIMDTFLANLKVSTSLRKRMKKYASIIWRDEQGYAMPYWLENAPRDLRLDLMAVMYSHHLQEDPIFSYGHEDLLFQMTGYLRRYIFLPGDTIVEKDDVDGCLYILDKGEVKALIKDKFFVEKIVDKIQAGRIFGIQSGLLEGKGHDYTYRASSKCVVLVLNQKDWKYLFEFFPASKESILSRALQTDDK